jgi:ABC-type branched-subunit amino acid transport system substrate-binding protein
MLTGLLASLICVGVSLAAGEAGALSQNVPSHNTAGVTAKSVSVGQVDTLSGPVPGLFVGAEHGTKAYFAYINSTGGVYGRQLKLQVADDQFSSSGFAAGTQSLASSSLAFVGSFSLFDQAGIPTINSQKIPDVALSLSDQMNLNQYNYSPQPLVPGGVALGPLKYFREKDKAATQHVATLIGGVASAESQSNAVVNGAKSLGYRFVYSRVTNPVETTFTADVLKMKSEGVQMVLIAGEAVNSVASLAKEMAQQDFKPKVFVTTGVAYDTSYIPSASSTAANGTETAQGVSMYAGQDAKVVPAVATFDKWVKKVAPGAKIDIFTYYGWSSAQLFVQALRAAGPNPTRASLLAQLDKITSFTASGMQASANPAGKVPGPCWLLIGVVDGKWRRLPPSPKSGFVCNPGGYHVPAGTKPFRRQPPPPGS